MSSGGGGGGGVFEKKNFLVPVVGKIKINPK